MFIQSVLSFLERPAVRRWFSLFSGVPGSAKGKTAHSPAGAAIPGEAPPASPAPEKDGEKLAVIPAGEDEPIQARAAVEKPASGQAIITIPDPEIESLRREISLLKERNADLFARRVEMEQLVQRFEYSQYLILGDRLVENLRLRHEYLKSKARKSGATEDLEAAQEAAAELEAYQSIRERGSAETPISLEAEDLDELKRLYRATVMRCHPDRVDAADKSAAHDLFLRTQAAYRQNDLDGLRLIHRQLVGDSFCADSIPASNDYEALLLVKSDLQQQAADLILAIQTMQLDETYRKAKCTHDWDDYFVSVRELLDAESYSLKQKIRVFSTT